MAAHLFYWVKCGRSCCQRLFKGARFGAGAARKMERCHKLKNGNWWPIGALLCLT